MDPARSLVPAPGRSRQRAPTHAEAHQALIEALAEHNVRAARVLCLRRDAVESGVEGVELRMPVREPMAFWYPLRPTKSIEHGRKQVAFEPPIETLSGERIHQWIGARYRVHGPGSDLERIARQQELVAVALGDGLDFRRFLAPAEAVRVSDPTALRELSRVRPGWRFETLGPTDTGDDRRQGRAGPGPGLAAKERGGGNQPLHVEIARAVLARVDLAVPDHVVAVEGDLPAAGDGGDERGPGLVLGLGALDAERVAPVLELDPDRVEVGAGFPEKRGRRSAHPPGVFGGIRLVHELADAPVEPDEVVGADAAARTGEPGNRRLVGPHSGVDDQGLRPVPLPPALPVWRRVALDRRQRGAG